MESPVLRSVWEHVSGHIAGVGLGGIAPAAVDDYGYHQAADRHYAGTTRFGNDDYSVQLPSDRCPSISQYFCALDLTGDASTRIVSRRLLQASSVNDPRIACLREWFGSLDNRVVVGRTHSSPTGAWTSASADDSHLTHNHLSLFRCYATKMSVVSGLVDVILGVPMALEASDITALAKAVWATEITPGKNHRQQLGWEAGRTMAARDVLFGAYVHASKAGAAATANMVEVTALHAAFDALDADCDIDQAALQAAIDNAVGGVLDHIRVTVDPVDGDDTPDAPAVP